MVMMTTAMSLNFILLVNFIELLIVGHPLFRISLGFLPEKSRDTMEFLLQFVAPWVVVNYFLIFWKQRYKKLIVKYPHKNGSLFVRYFAISIFVPIVLLWVGMLLRRP